MSLTLINLRIIERADGKLAAEVILPDRWPSTRTLNYDIEKRSEDGDFRLIGQKHKAVEAAIKAALKAIPGR